MDQRPLFENFHSTVGSCALRLTIRPDHNRNRLVNMRNHRQVQDSTPGFTEARLALHPTKGLIS